MKNQQAEEYHTGLGESGTSSQQQTPTTAALKNAQLGAPGLADDGGNGGGDDTAPGGHSRVASLQASASGPASNSRWHGTQINNTSESSTNKRASQNGGSYTHQGGAGNEASTAPSHPAVAIGSKRSSSQQPILTERNSINSSVVTQGKREGSSSSSKASGPSGGSEGRIHATPPPGTSSSIKGPARPRTLGNRFGSKSPLSVQQRGLGSPVPIATSSPVRSGTFNSFSQRFNPTADFTPGTPGSLLSDESPVNMNATEISADESFLYRHTVRRMRNRQRGGFGLWGWQPPSAQWLLAPLPFLIFLCTYVFVQSLILSGYTPAVLSTLEKRYNFLTTESGLIVSAYDIGSLMVVVFVSFFGGQGHRPHWIAFGAGIAGTCTILMALPQLLSGPYRPDASNLKLVESTEPVPLGHADLCHHNTSFLLNPSKVHCHESITEDLKELVDRSDRSSLYFVSIFLCNFLNGVGSTPIFTLGTSFLFDNVPSQAAPMYVGALYLTGAVGPAVGYVVCGLFLKVYVDPWLNAHVEPNNPAYVGAWWLGYIIFGFLILLTSIPLYFYPRRIPKNPEDTKKPKEDRPPPAVSQTQSTKRAIANSELTNNERFDSERALLNQSSFGSNGDTDDIQSMDTTMSMSFGNTISDIPKTFLRIASNPIFLFITLGATCEFTIISAFMNFIPKYLEAQFSIAASNAAIMCGACLVPGAGVGIVVGSKVVSWLNLTRTGCTKLTLSTLIAGLLLFLPTYFINCPNPNIVGVNEPYPDVGNIRDTRAVPGFLGNTWKTDVMDKCNQDCQCDPKIAFEPVCWVERDATFFNPCLAGCTKTELRNLTDGPDQFDYYDCSCLEDSNGAKGNTIRLAEGACPRNCNLILFMAMLFIVTAATSAGQTPALIVTMTSVSESDRPMALGVQFLFYRTLAYIPAPIYFGRIIDSACVLRQSTDDCGDGEGACALYDADQFRKLYFGLSMSIKTVGILLVICAARFSMNRDKVEAEEAKRLEARDRRIQGMQKEARHTPSPVNQELMSLRGSHQYQNSNAQDSCLGGIPESAEDELDK